MTHYKKTEPGTTMLLLCAAVMVIIFYISPLMRVETAMIVHLPLVAVAIMFSSMTVKIENQTVLGR